MRVFWAKGYSGAGLADLQRAMGIGRKSLYDTFGNKRRLFEACLQRYTDTVVLAITEVLARPGPPLDNIRESLEYIHRANGKRVSNGCLLGVSMAQFRTDQPEISEILRNHLHVLEAAFEAQFRRARELDQISDDSSPRDLARAMVATVQGLTLIRRVNDAPAMSRGILRGAFAMLDGLKVR